MNFEWVFCKEDGSWTTIVSYYESIYKVSKKLGLSLSNNHAFRMTLNSYAYVPIGLPATERAELLGHSIDTNLKFYTFARINDYIDELCDKTNAFKGGTESIPTDSSIEKATGTSKLFHLKQKKKALNPLKLRLSSKNL